MRSMSLLRSLGDKRHSNYKHLAPLALKTLQTHWKHRLRFMSALHLNLKKGDIMTKLVFNIAVLVMITIGLTPAPTQRASLAAPAPASANLTCDFQSCMTKCVKLGYLGGTCG